MNNIKIITLVFFTLFAGVLNTEVYAEVAVQKYIRLKGEQKWDEALQVIRKEISKPLLNTPSYKADLRIIGIGALGDFADVKGFNNNIDDEAKHYYEEGLENAKGDKARMASLHGVYSRYFSDTGRLGFSIPYMDLELKTWEELGNTYQIIKVNDGKASAYHDMGETTLSEYYRKKAFDVAADYYHVGKKPEDANEWLQYYNMLGKHADNISGKGRSEELKSILDLRLQITKKYLSFLSKTYMQHAEYYAIDGNYEEAMKLFSLAEEQLTVEKKKLKKKLKKDFWEKMDLDMTCAQANILLRSKSYSEAAKIGMECEKGWKRLGKLRGATLGTLGLIYESAGDDERALHLYSDSISSFEDTRSSYEIAQRATFFQSVSRRPYWGLIRILGKKAANTGKDEDFYNFLQASERIRARQFGDLVYSQQESTLSLQRLKSYVNNLDNDTAVITFILTDSAIVIGAFTKDEKLVRIEPYNRQSFRSQIRNIVMLLADPGSNLAFLQQSLLTAGKLIITPIRELIDEKNKLVVITDGELNLVPFDLWSSDDNSYQPIVKLKNIRSTPALRLLTNSKKIESSSNGLFAVGDPIYQDPTDEIAGISSTEIEQATRSVNFQSYFSPLPETRTEVESIALLFNKQPTQVLLGEKAIESNIKNSKLDSFRYLHFATHGIIGGEVPGITEPALVLGKEDSEDGFLKASEAEKLSLNADLTVLSACNTGSGEFVNGEGVMSISRSFLISGSNSVLVSLWSVASKTTEDLMVKLYEHIHEGIPPDVALRAAKLDIMNEVPHPFFWAPFVLISKQ